MSAKESNTWQWLRGALGHFGPLLTMRRVENLVSTGDGDVDGILDGKPFDLELKAAKRPARPTTKLRHEPVKRGQIDYAKAVLAAGGAHAFLVQVGEAWERRFFLVHGALGDWLAAGRTENELASHTVEVYSAPEAVERATMMKGAWNDGY